MKLKFEELLYDPYIIVWGLGNDLVGPQLLARIQLREPTKKEDRAAKSDYERVRDIFNNNVNLGQRFKASGKDASRGIECKITYINNSKQSVTWKQDNAETHPDFIGKGYKPAAGKWSINAFIAMIKSGRIEIINN